MSLPNLASSASLWKRLLSDPSVLSFRFSCKTSETPRIFSLSTVFRMTAKHLYGVWKHTVHCEMCLLRTAVQWLIEEMAHEIQLLALSHLGHQDRWDQAVVGKEASDEVFGMEVSGGDFVQRHLVRALLTRERLARRHLLGILVTRHLIAWI